MDQKGVLTPFHGSDPRLFPVRKPVWIEPQRPPFLSGGGISLSTYRVVQKELRYTLGGIILDFWVALSAPAKWSGLSSLFLKAKGSRGAPL
jgi:hypothetical protein